MYNVAVIGCGYMGQTHLEDIYLKDSINLYAVCDLDEEKAKLNAQRYNADKYFTNSDDVIEDKNVDIVIIATYPSSHLALLEKCLKNNKHVLCEKPITKTYEDGIKFKELCDKNPQCKVLVGHILRHNSTYTAVAKLIEDDTIGKPIVMRMVQNHQVRQWGKYQSLIEETSPIIDCGVHYVDVMRWFTGAEVINVSGVGAVTVPSVPSGKYNHGMIHLTMSDGSIGFYEAGWSRTAANNNIKEFIGPKGRIKITYQKDRDTHKESGNLISIYRYPENVTEFINVPFIEKPTGAELDHLIKMIEDNIPALPTIEDVLKSFEVVCKADKMITENMNKKEL